MELKQIKSFQADHDLITPGIYLSRQDGDADTFDLRMVTPNRGNYLPIGAMHTLEHLLATFLRSGKESEHIIYVGPMGCRTGFYLITRNLPLERVLTLCREAFAFCADFSGKIPGSTRKECGNYRSHNLPGAKKLAKAMQEVLETKQVSDMTYPTK